ncbi:hypothetical protein CROQUDRAFT_87462 [Cronartium quercuum f. sp. fusiforme G11]|uniref:Uncharacterized protein n=1 Tax=Cronartium quercuum f. sp. fusiforme G11 TaxID=708437 RepID=A0A9P6NVC9_9BASI|nr:hypothetical protein CROQUDRAFT_87462 [Cronartium quercuum f. sp. fusiforme G11]
MSQWDAAIRILNYLITTKFLQLGLGGRQPRRIPSGSVFGAISWKSKKKPTVSSSSKEAKYIWLCRTPVRKLYGSNIYSLNSIYAPGLPFPSLSTTEEAEALARNPKHHTKTRT